MLPHALEVAERCFNHQAWEYGAPYQPESWPGMRFHGALWAEALAAIEMRVTQLTGKDKLWMEQPPAGLCLDCNVYRLFSISCWIAGFNGRVPYTGSPPASAIFCNAASLVSPPLFFAPDVRPVHRAVPGGESKKEALIHALSYFFKTMTLRQAFFWRFLMNFDNS